MKSKGLALTGSFHSPVFLSPSYNYSSQSYPTLLPSWQALAYIISGDLTISWPLQFQQAWLWTAGAVALIALADQYARGMFLLPLVWVVTPEVVWQSMQGYADVPMALMLVLGAVVLWKGPQNPRAHVVAGVLLAGAALTKSEGTPLVAIILLSLLFTRRPNLVSGVAPALVFVAALPWFMFARMHGLRGDLVDWSTVTSWIRGEAPGQMLHVVSIMGQELFSPFRWGVLVPACLLAALLARRSTPGWVWQRCCSWRCSPPCMMPPDPPRAGRLRSSCETTCIGFSLRRWASSHSQSRWDGLNL